MTKRYPVFKGNLEQLTIRNKNYRKVISTTKQEQLVLMSLNPGEEIGMEIHPHTTQFVRIETGKGIAIVGGKRYTLKDGDAVMVPANTYHNFIATTEPIKLYTIYAPPHHPPHQVQRYKEDNLL